MKNIQGRGWYPLRLTDSHETPGKNRHMRTNLHGLPVEKRPSLITFEVVLRMSLSLLLALLAPRRAQAATITYSDETFNPSDWELTIAWEFYPGTSVAGFQQYPGGGNPGEFGGVSLRSVAPNAVAVMRPETYDPTVQGEILSISSSADVRLLRNVGADGFLPYRPLISQNGQFFYGLWAMGVSSGNWVPFAFGSNVLTAARFIGVGDAAALHPDFSARGAPLQFGFMVDSGTLFSARDSELGVDNWCMTINTVPEPGLGAFTLLTFVTWALSRWSRPRCPAMTRMGFWQPGQHSGSTCQTRRIKSRRFLEGSLRGGTGSPTCQP